MIDKGFKYAIHNDQVYYEKDNPDMFWWVNRGNTPPTTFVLYARDSFQHVEVYEVEFITEKEKLNYPELFI